MRITFVRNSIVSIIGLLFSISALAVTNVDIAAVDADGNSLQSDTLVLTDLSEGGQTQVVKDEDGDNRFIVPFFDNQGESDSQGGGGLIPGRSYSVEITDADGNVQRGTFTAPDSAPTSRVIAVPVGPAAMPSTTSGPGNFYAGFDLSFLDYGDKMDSLVNEGRVAIEQAFPGADITSSTDDSDFSPRISLGYYFPVMTPDEKDAKYAQAYFNAMNFGIAAQFNLGLTPDFEANTIGRFGNEEIQFRHDIDGGLSVGGDIIFNFGFPNGLNTYFSVGMENHDLERTTTGTIRLDGVPVDEFQDKFGIGGTEVTWGIGVGSSFHPFEKNQDKPVHWSIFYQQTEQGGEDLNRFGVSFKREF